MTAVDRLSATDAGYKDGDLSIFPQAIDSPYILYTASNNSSTQLKQTLAYNGQVVVVDDATSFPSSGQIRVGSNLGDGVYELIYYDKKVGNTFQNLKRGMAGTKQNYWAAKINYVTNPVAADYHNTIKDAIINIEKDLGVKDNPDPASLNGILKYQEQRFLTPKPLFRASFLSGAPPLNVRFQNFSTGDLIRYFWDFGDGITSIEESPNHIYKTEGIYTVSLNVITSTGAQGIVTKTNYINVSADAQTPFFYVDSTDNPYSVQTAAAMTVGEIPPYVPVPTQPKNFLFVDQSDGDIIQRIWIFGDNVSTTQSIPDIHDITHTYDVPGDYIVTLLLVYSTGQLTRVELPNPLTVT